VVEFGFFKICLIMPRTLLTLTILVPLLTSCGLADRFFTTNECEGDNCQAPVLLDNSNVEQEWFCYGKAEGETWQCQNERDPSKISVIEQKTAQPTPARSDQTAAAAMTIPAPEPVSSPPSPPASVRLPATSVFENEVMAHPREHYAVQLIALRDIAGVAEYAGLNGIQDPKMVKIRNGDTDWYVLLLGIYPDRELAESARATWLTAKVLRVEPWIRQLGPLQDAIMAAGG
jgi:septal ring-binding cell division protein DamX